MGPLHPLSPVTGSATIDIAAVAVPAGPEENRVTSPSRFRVDRRRFLIDSVLLTAAWCVLRETVTPVRSAFPRVVRDAIGREVALTRAPQRIAVVTEYAALDSVLALGVAPVAAVRRYAPDWPWTASAGGAGVPRLQERPDGPELARIADLAPDLVLLLRDSAESVERWSRVAPTVCYDGDDAHACLRVVADALGASARAEAVIRRFDDRVAAARERISAAGRAGATFTSFIVYPDGSAGFYGAETGDALLLAALGLRPGPLTASRPDWGAVATDAIPRLDADVVLGRHEDPSVDAAFARFEADPRFRALPAVADGRYTRLSWTESWGVASCSLLGWDAVLDRLTDIVVATSHPRP